MSKVTLEIFLDPKVDQASIKKVLQAAQSAAGSGSISVKVDPSAAQQVSKITAEAGRARDAMGRFVKSTNEAAASAGKLASQGSMISKAFNFNMMVQAVSTVANAFGQVVDTGAKYESALAAVSAITGVTGSGLDNLGSKARDLAKQFGGSATSQLQSFQGILSKIGPQMANDADALGLFAKNVNVLAAAGGMDAASAMDAITNSLLQMGLASGAPSEVAENSTKVINSLAASAKVGAAEIPQISEAFLQVGSTAKTLNQDVDQVNAALQTLAVGGKTGSEAGVALRNTMLLMVNASGPAAAELKKFGTSSQELGKLIATSGVDAALGKIKAGMESLSESEKAASLAKIFGMENVAAAGILIDNLDTYQEFLDGIKAGGEGIGSAFEQAAINMDTTEGSISRWKAQFDDLLITVQQAAGKTVSAILGTTTQVAPLIMSFAGLKDILPVENVKRFGQTVLNNLYPSLVRASAGQAALAGATAASGTAANAANVSFKAFGYALLTNPIFQVVAGVAAAVAAIKLLSDALDVTAAERIADAEAQRKVTQEELATTQQRRAVVENNQQIIDSYRQIGDQSKATGAEHTKYMRIMEQLAARYPGLVSEQIGYEQSLKNVEAQFKKNVTEIDKLGKRAAELKMEDIKLNVELGKLNVEKAAEDIEDTLTDSLNTYNWSDFGKTVAEVGFGGFAVQMASTLQGQKTGIEKARDQIGEWLGLGSSTRNSVKEMIQNYAKDIKAAKNDAELQDAVHDFKMMIYAQKLDPEAKAKALEGINEMGKAQAEALKRESQAQVDEAGFWMEEFKKKGMQAEPAIAAVAKQMGIGVDKARQLVAEQEKQVQKAKDAGKEIEGMARAFDAVKEAADKAFGMAFSEELNKTLAYEDALATKDKAKIAAAKQNLELARSATAAADKTRDRYAEIEEKVRKRYETQKKAAPEILKELDALRKRNAEDEKTVEKQNELARLKAGQEKSSADELANIGRKIQHLNEEKALLDSIISRYGSINEQGQINFKTGVSDDNKRKLETALLQWQSDMAEAGITQLTIEARVKSDTAQAAQEVKKLQDELISRKLDSIKLQAELGIIDPRAYIDESKALISQQLASAALEEFAIRAKLSQSISNQERLSLMARLEDLKNIRLNAMNQIGLLEQQERDIASTAEINQITDMAGRQRAIRVNEAKKAFNEELKTARGNYQAELDAWIKYQDEKRAAEEDYYRQSNILYALSQELQAGFSNMTAAKGNEEEINRQKADLEKQEQALAVSYQKREISTEEYLSRRKELEDQAQQLEQQRITQWVATINAANDAISSSLQNFANQRLNTITALYEQLSVLDEQKNTLEVQRALAASAMVTSILAGNLQAYAEYSGQYAAITGQINAIDEKRASMMNMIYMNTAAMFGSTVASLMAKGTSFIKAMVKAALGGLKALVPIIIAQAYGLYGASPNPLNVLGLGLPGILEAGIFTAAFMGLVSAAESAIGFRKGGYTGKGGIVHEEEFVFTKEMTSRNREAYEKMLRNKWSPEQYVVNEKGELIRAEAVKQLAQYEEHARKSEKIIRQLEKDRAGQQQLYADLNRTMKQLVNQNEQLRQEVERGNTERKTINRVDVNIETDESQILKKIDVEKYARLRFG